MAEKHLEQRKVFGRYLRNLRKGLPETLSQQAAAARLLQEPEGNALSWKITDGTNLQYNLARIESGKVALQPEILPALSRIYNEPLDRLATAFVASLIYGKPEMPDHLNLPSRKHISTTADGNFFLSSAIEAWTLDDIAKWESSLADRFEGRNNLELWIVSPDFVDYRKQEFQQIVANDLIARGVTITYCIDARDYGDRQNFGTFLNKVTRLLCERRVGKPAEGMEGCSSSQWGKIRAYLLSPDELAWFTSSVVIANPEDTQTGRTGAEGFIIAPIAGDQWVGIPIVGRNLEALAEKILHQVDHIKLDNKLSDRFIEDALLECPLYKQRILHNGK